MNPFRIITRADGVSYVERRKRFPWPHWSPERRWVCTGADIEPELRTFATVEEARTWAANAERRARPDHPDLFPEDSQ